MAERQNPKLLLIAYYWPPAGGPGVQRWLKLTHYLAEAGVDVHVLSPDPAYASYLQRDESLVHDVNGKVKVHLTRSFEIINWYAKVVGKKKVPVSGFSNVDNASWKQQLASGIRSHFFVPDPRVGWKRYAVKRAREVIETYGIETVITTSPPHSVQLIGRELRRETGIRWIADFRDPWTDIYFYELFNHSRWSAARDKRLERSVLTEADHIITVSEGFKKLFLVNAPERKSEDISVIPNGFDRRDFSVEKAREEDGKFVIGYTGTMSDQYLPSPFLRAVAKATSARPELKITLQLVGSVSENIRGEIAELGIITEYVGTVPHAEVNGYQQRADLLLLAVPQVPRGEGIVPGKLFEYLASGTPVLSLGPAEAEVGIILERCGAGRHFHGGQEVEMADFIDGVASGRQSFRRKENIIATFEREQQALEVRRILIDS